MGLAPVRLQLWAICDTSHFRGHLSIGRCHYGSVPFWFYASFWQGLYHFSPPISDPRLDSGITTWVHSLPFAFAPTVIELCQRYIISLGLFEIPPALS